MVKRGRARVCRAGEGSKRRSRVAVCVEWGAVRRVEIGGREGVLAVAVVVMVLMFWRAASCVSPDAVLFLEAV